MRFAGITYDFSSESIDHFAKSARFIGSSAQNTTRFCWGFKKVRKLMENRFDVIVIGGGHAGIEAAHAAANMGSNTALLSLHKDKIGSMPCNPSVGGLGKGHIVYEVSALGGLMPKLCSQTYLQARMLNTSKGPAVQGLRLQIDKYQYSKKAQEVLNNLKNLTIIEASAQQILTEDINGSKKIIGIQAEDGRCFYAPTVVITTGTFMRGVVHIGRTRYKAGRRGELASYGLSDSIAAAMGVNHERMKTGTPPRILRSTIDFSKIAEQEPQQLDYLFEFDPINVINSMPCYIATTNAQTSQIIQDNMHLSASGCGNIFGLEPRYCPSIESKIKRFPDRTSHHVFIEPEGALPGEGFEEIYPAGISTSMPLDVQEAYIRTIVGFENAVIAKCGYAIEYDFIQPHNLTHALETKTVSGLFLAGQINGTTGYEEAAGQGIMAGINASLKAAGKEPFILGRHESYLGVMIDDMVSIGVDEPYRMFTSRAERRLMLRQDNVFLRLMPYGRELGLINDKLYAQFLAEKEIIEQCVRITKGLGNHHELTKLLRSIEFTEEIRSHVRNILTQELTSRNLSIEALSNRALLSIHAEIKYEGYLKKEQLEVDKALRYQNLDITELDVSTVESLNKEMQEKLKKYKPKTIAQAELIPGMTPATISILIFRARKIR